MRIFGGMLVPIILLAICAAAWALSGDFFQLSLNGQTYTCGYTDGSWQAGKLKANGSFIAFKKLAKASKTKASKASGQKRKKLLLSSKRNKAQARLKDPICIEQANNLALPTAVPTPEPSSGNFDLNGDITAAGRTLFQIPAGLDANISIGRTLHEIKCSGCHLEQLNRSFPSYRSRTMDFPMGFTTESLPDSELAHITAFLNRFRRN